MAAPQELVKDLETQLEALESSLQPLFATKSLDDYARTLQPMQEAKLDNMIAYLIHDLSWMLLKTKGVDPAAHPVLAELERVKAYFGKVAAASKAPEPAPKLDKDAANRFIKHAIASSGPLPPSKPASNPRARPSEPPEIGTSSRFSFLTKPNDHVGPPTDSDEDLAVIDDAEDATRNKKGKGKATDDAIDVDEEPSAFPDKRKKSKRPKVDPFAGYDEQPKSDDRKEAEGSVDEAEAKRQKKKRKKEKRERKAALAAEAAS